MNSQRLLQRLRASCSGQHGPLVFMVDMMATQALQQKRNILLR